ncbi:putative microtubule-associated protein [Phaeoacremonium minimum UCRPA7]|uniref:Mediator of RNA polymerase II transcription subunit 9 n=1 Tax=Phaeoacremonium minimum (strain UCR-PA7) TaxID=1286976 RepID=R8BRG6_PHAM7|nr:putative microtubule-associated protein [Phaeoacremonium minimum UCRPA7]EOO01973.1 putative microtubule-associated protein [Phaeoacremonium minimum UCRPA7]
MPSAPTEPHPLALPAGLSPDSIDTLTELALILSRLRPPQSNGSTTGLATGATPAATQVTGTTPLPSSAPAGSPGGSGTLNLKDVPTATDSIKHKLQKARAQIRQLPDMNRSIAAQEAEIVELLTRMAQQREVLGRLKDVGAAFGADGDEGRDKMEM